MSVARSADSAVDRPVLKAALRAIYWIVPIAFCVYLYWLGLRIWFAQDDFAWLNLRNQVIDFPSFLAAMFKPLAQGTIRPLSERGFFMLFSYFFGLRALPYRTFVFLNQFLNIVLVMVVTRKLTRSRVAAFIAPLLWISCNALITPMSWTSAYNEIQCTTFLLLSFYLFVQYTDTDNKRFYWLQWVTFIAGFGALEINVVYPALAAGYAFLFARRYVRSTLPMFAVSGVYAVVHQMVATQDKGFYYDMNYHAGSIVTVLLKYWSILFGVNSFVRIDRFPHWMAGAATILFTAAILGFVAYQAAAKRRFLPLFLLFWFFVVLGPLLPLHNHVTDYYLTIPAIGIAILAAHGIALAFERSKMAGALACIVAAAYAVPSSIVDKQGMLSYFDRADKARAVVQSVAYAKSIHPGKTILLKGISDEVFWAAIYDSPFRIFGWSDVFLTPESRQQIREDLNLGSLDPYILPEAATARVVEDGTALVYAMEGRRLHNITRIYRASLMWQGPPAISASIDAGQPYFSGQLGEGWYGSENGHRWCKQHAVVYLAGPSAAGQKLRIHGFAQEEQVRERPLKLSVTIDNRPVAVSTIDLAHTEFHFEYSIPAEFVGRPKVEIGLTLDRMYHFPTDDRALGLVFGEFAIR